ncbi:hypothetical protein [Streptomyces sp. NPDC020747]|uniref:hypothetical protein n=1 Tax=Streptomyces sp. NPDC020747 TaxID=3365086 RepID=UPI0037B6F855
MRSEPPPEVGRAEEVQYASSDAGRAWRKRIEAAEAAVQGEAEARGRLSSLLPSPRDAEWLGTPRSVADFGYFMALLRELELWQLWLGHLSLAEQWIVNGRTPPEHRCLVLNRLATIFTEAAEEKVPDLSATHALSCAQAALDSALRSASTRTEEAYTRSGLALLAAREGRWRRASAQARRGERLARGAREDKQRLDIRMRTTSVLFLAARQGGSTRRVRRFARDLEAVCQQQIDRWGSGHLRSLEALALMASARHELAFRDRDLERMDRLTDVLAATAQRLSATLGARHPQARAVRGALEQAYEATERVREEEAPVREEGALAVHGREEGGPVATRRRAEAAAPEPEEEPPPEPQGAAPSRWASSSPSGPLLELLLHGIDGATPEEMLGDPRVVRITGDDTSAFYRRLDDVHAEQEDDRTSPVPEAYSWAKLASVGGSRALWFLLLPFLVVNLAHWMHPVAQGRPRVLRLHGILVRLAALSLTVLMVAAACELSMDLVAWQCAGSAACARGQSFWLDFMSPSSGGWWSRPGPRLMAGALLPGALVVLLWRLSHRTWNAYESQRPPERRPEPESGSWEPALSLPGFWYGRRLVARLNAAHTTAGCLVVAAFLTLAPARFDRGPDGVAELAVAGWILEGAITALAVSVVWVVCRRGHAAARIDPRTDPLVRRLPAVSAALLLLAVGYALWSRPNWQSVARLPGVSLFSVGPLVQGLLVVALGVVGHSLHRSTPNIRTALSGLAPAAAVMLACFLYNILAAGAVHGLSDWLSRSAGADDSIAGPPLVMTWQVSAIPVLLALFVVQAGTLSIRLRLTERRAAASVGYSYPDEPQDALRSRTIAAALARATVADFAPLLVSSTAAAAAVFNAYALTGPTLTDTPPGRASGEASGMVREVAETAQALGSWLIAAGLLLFLAFGRRTRSSPDSRGALGMLWDLATFWPRAAHPFARLCYSERAVPDLVWRLTAWGRSTGGRILISGHSQGSVLAVAALWQLDPSLRKRVMLLTYGSPLERLYGRWFPAYFGPVALSGLHREVDVWRNLWRPTDPLGGPVRLVGDAGSEVDRYLKDPLTYGRSLHHPLPAPILGHAEYAADPSFAEERLRMIARSRPPLPPSASRLHESPEHQPLPPRSY